MPLPKYYCDYCDKQFQDTASARKRHLQGVQHQRARALYYDSFKAPTHIQADTPLCNHFVRTGFCQYGDSCRYIHPKLNTPNPSMQVKPVVNSVEIGQSATVLGNQFIREDFIREDAIRDGMGVSLGNLPPSLRPPPEGGYPPLPFVEWG